MAKDYLRRSLLSIEAHLRVPHEVIVIEDGGADGTLEMLRAEFPQVHLIENGRNLGVIDTRIKGIEVARGELLFFVDSDVELLPGVFEALHAELLSHATIAYVTCNKRSVDGSHQRSAFPWPTLWGNMRAMVPFLRRADVRASLDAHQRPSEPGWISVGHSLMRTRAYRECGGFIRDVFFFGEDVDICAKLRDKGWRVRFIPFMGFVHHGSISQTSDPERFRLKSSDQWQVKSCWLLGGRYPGLDVPWLGRPFAPCQGGLPPIGMHRFRLVRRRRWNRRRPNPVQRMSRFR